MYLYQEVKGQCSKVPGGSLLEVKGSYLPIMIQESHWIGAAILPEEKRIVLYDPSGEQLEGMFIMKYLLRLVVDEFKREGGRS